jgi:microcystin-dependent protein
MANNLVNPVRVVDSTDNTKKVALDPSAATTNTTATITTSQVIDRTYSIPDSGASSAFVMAEGASTINGTKTFNGSVVIKESGGSDTITISAPVLAASYSLTLPVDDGTSNNQVLSTDGSGVLSWQSMLPAGISLDYSGISVPAGWLEEDGSVVSQAVYPNLFSAIGTLWNTGGEGVGNFRLPNMSRRASVGRGGVGTGTLGNVVGNTGGEEGTVLTIFNTPLHFHNSGTLVNSSSSVSGSSGPNSVGHTHSGTTGSISPSINIDNGGGTGTKTLAGNYEVDDGTPAGDFGTAHTHPFTTGGESISHTHTISGTAAAQTISGSTSSAGFDKGDGLPNAHNTIQPSAIKMKIIKY